MNRKYTISSIGELNEITSEMFNEFKEIRVFIFKGDLGAGKTTLIKSLCKKLNVKDDITSPSFSLINEYKTSDGKRVYHFDLYRLESFEEVEDIGFFEYLDSGNYCFIEWPEIAEDYIDPPFLEINIEIMENNDRNIIFLEHLQPSP